MANGLILNGQCSRARNFRVSGSRLWSPPFADAEETICGQMHLGIEGTMPGHTWVVKQPG
jgi:hypothetical protein